MCDEQLKYISVRLGRVLDIIGASEEVRRERQRNAVTSEILMSLASRHFDNSKQTTYIFGSASEGSTIPGLHSDVDTLLCNGDNYVFDRLEESIPKGEHFLMVQDEDTSPGYTKLQVILDGIAVTDDMFKDAEAPISVFKDGKGRILYLNTSPPTPEFCQEKHGPAATVLAFNRDGVDGDFIGAFRCHSWPRQAGEFLTRVRKMGWPTDEDITMFSVQGCFVVPVGHPLSKETDQEWRLSFSLQERHLMFNLNQTQFKTYIILKLLKNCVFMPAVGEKSITSYHCKTCLFYTIEESEMLDWTPENLIPCVHSCLVKLKSFIRSKRCPNYFIPKENMFEKVSNEILEKLGEQIDHTLDNLPSVLQTIQTNNVGRMLCVETNQQNDTECQKIIFMQRFHTVTFVLSQVEAHLKFALKGNDTSECISCHENAIRLLENPEFTDHTKAETDEACELILPFLYTSLGSHLYSRALSENKDKQETLDDQLQRLLYVQKGRNSDLLAGALKHAAVELAGGQYNNCYEILKSVEAFADAEPCSLCCCTSDNIKRQKEYFFREAILDRTEMRQTSTKDFLRRAFCTCVRFLPTEMEITPHYLKFEIFRDTAANRPAVMDAIVLFYYLRYCVLKQMNRMKDARLAMGKLLQVMLVSRSLGHRDTSWNVIGCIVMECGNLPLAYSNFVQSLKLQSANNVACWHLALLIAKALGVA